MRACAEQAALAWCAKLWRRRLGEVISKEKRFLPCAGLGKAACPASDFTVSWARRVEIKRRGFPGIEQSSHALSCWEWECLEKGCDMFVRKEKTFCPLGTLAAV